MGLTLDTFGFPVEGRSSARRAVLWPRLPKVAFLGVKNAVFQPHRPPRGPPCDAVNTKKLSFLCSAMMASKNLDDVSKKLILGPQTAHFGYIRPYNSPPSSRMGTYQKTKVIQSYLMMWASYDPIQLGPSKPIAIAAIAAIAA